MMHHAIDGGGCRHGVFEDSIPLTENEVAGDGDAFALVAFREKCEEHFHLIATLLHVANVIEDDEVECVECCEVAFELLTNCAAMLAR
jgi:hypothetical protein